MSNIESDTEVGQTAIFKTAIATLYNCKLPSIEFM